VQDVVLGRGPGGQCRDQYFQQYSPFLTKKWRFTLNRMLISTFCIGKLAVFSLSGIISNT
jgi:hypothetical protein